MESLEEAGLNSYNKKVRESINVKVADEYKKRVTMYKPDKGTVVNEDTIDVLNYSVIYKIMTVHDFGYRINAKIYGMMKKDKDFSICQSIIDFLKADNSLEDILRPDIIKHALSNLDLPVFSRLERLLTLVKNELKEYGDTANINDLMVYDGAFKLFTYVAVENLLVNQEVLTKYYNNTSSEIIINKVFMKYVNDPEYSLLKDLWEIFKENDELVDMDSLYDALKYKLGDDE